MAGFAQWIYQRRRPRWLRQLEGQRKPLPPLYQKRGDVGRLLILSAAVGLALKAALTGGVLVSIFLGAVGAALYFYTGTRATSLAHEQVTDGVGELVAAYYSAYLVIPTVFGALSEAIKTLTNPFLQSAVQRALDAFGTGKTS